MTQDQTTTDPAEIRDAIFAKLAEHWKEEGLRDWFAVNGMACNLRDAAVEVIAGCEQAARREIERLNQVANGLIDDLEREQTRRVNAEGDLRVMAERFEVVFAGVDFGDHAGCTLVEKTGMVRGNLDNLRAENARLNARADEYFHREREMGEKLREQSEALARKDAEIKQVAAECDKYGRELDRLRVYLSEHHESYYGGHDDDGTVVGCAIKVLEKASAALSGGDQ